jgi:DNA polymerase-3 subunit alpha (Gram-positive type)
MYSRGIKFLPIDLYKSDAVKFQVTPEGIRPPLNALQGLGANAAQSIVEARKNGEFISIEELRQKSRISKSVIEILKDNGCLGGLSETSQMSFF